MTLTLAMANRQALLNDYNGLFGSASQLAIFAGSAPATADTAYSGNTILAALPFSSTPFGTATAATPSVMTANAITQENAYATGTATFYRCFAEGTSGITGSSFVVGNTYMIQAMGSSTSANWISMGFTGTTASAGCMFVATATTLTGSGTAYLMNCMEQGAVGTSGQDLNLNTTSIVAAGPVAVTSFVRQM